MSELLIGLDVGTSSVKAAVFDRQGGLRAVAQAPLVVHASQPGWAEQDPADWWHGAVQALREALSAVDPAQIAGVGLSGQCPGHVLVDAQGEAIGRAIIWRDSRAQAEAAWIAARISEEQALAWTGSRLLGDATLPPARLLWLKNQRAADWQRARAVLQPKDYLGLCLTGVSATDRHSAYCLAEPERDAYAPDYLALLGVDPAKLPPVLDPTQVLGGVTPAAAALTGLPAGAPVVTGTIDAWCDNLAGGVALPGRAVDVSGTSEIVSLGVSRPVEGQGVYPAVVGRDARFLCGPTQSGADTLRWFGQAFFPDLAGERLFAELDAAAGAVPAGSAGVVFLPYLSGERAPLWDAQARGAWAGLTLAHDRRHCARSVYEGVAFAVRHVLEACEQAAGQRAESMVVCGGGSRSRFWNQIKADVLQRPVQAAGVSQSACLGAAILAGVGVGVDDSLAGACRRLVRLNEPLAPDPANGAAYERAYQVYRALYPALAPVFHRQADGFARNEVR